VSRRPYVGPSEAQANAEALTRRGLPYSSASETSFTLKWDWHRREPKDLREAVRQVRAAFANEVPAKLHEGPDSIGEGGTPRMTPQAEGYIFGSPQSSDRSDPDQLVSYFRSPFRAALANMSQSSAESERRRAAIVSHVTLGSRGPKEAAIEEGVPSWCAPLVAEDALRSFLRSLTDLKLHVANEGAA
jgi:hypothetical protein